MTMYTRFGQAEVRYWRLEVNAMGKSYVQTQTIGVVAVTADEALQWVKENKTELQVVSIHYVGPVDNIKRD